MLGALVIIRLLTESLSVSMYGELTLVLSVLALVNQLIYGGIAQGAGRYYSISKEENSQFYYFKASFQIFKRATLILVLLSAISLLTLYKLSIGVSPYLAVSCILYAVFSGYNNLFNNVQGAARNRIKVALHAGFDAVLKILFALLAIQIFGGKDYVVIAAFMLSSFIVTLSQYFFIRRDYINTLKSDELNEKAVHRASAFTDFSKSKNYLHRIWAFSWPFSAWGIFTWAQLSSDRWSLQIFQSTDAVAFYAVLFEIGYRPITLIIGLIVNFMTPILFEQGSRINSVQSGITSPIAVTKTTRLITLICLLVTILGFVMATFMHSWLFSLIAAQQYAEVSFYLPWMVLAGGLFATGQVLGVKMMSDLNTVKSLPIKIISSVIGVALNFYGSWNFGFAGVIYASVIFSLIYFAMMLVAAEGTLFVSTSSKKDSPKNINS